MKNDNVVNDLAIIGIGCLFPKAEGPAGYWSNIKGRVDGIGEVPPSHWDPKDYFDGDPKSPDRTYGRRGGFLDPVDFDPTEFGITPNNIPATDPAQLLGLVTAQSALADAGYGPERSFDRRKVSVILGVTGTLELAIPLGARLGHPIWRRALREAGIAGEQAEAVIRRISDHYVEWQENSFPGLLGNVVAGRIANRLDLGGTNCVVDAACASSLSAAHLAALELATGRADMVVTGGVDTFNDIFMFMCFSKTPALSPTGDCRPFDSRGDGTILGEGIGMLVLKRLADAERDGDRVYAKLLGIGSSSDGRGKAIYAPSPEGQVKALKSAYALAGVTPDTIGLVEAHGTGTKAGDAAELEALTEVYRETGKPGTWCALGSVKSNLGHTKAAAGAAGLIKAALALKHKVLPPTIKVTEPLAELAQGSTPFYLNTEKRPWLPPSGRPRRAAVSAFGFGGSNFHAVLEEHRPEKTEIDWDRAVELLAFSAPDYDALLAELDAFEAPSNWAGLRAQAAASRKAFDRALPARLVVAIEKEKTDLSRLLAGLRETARKNRALASWSTRDGAYFGSGEPCGRLAALFPGQGAQYVGMGRDVACQFPDAHRTLAEADLSLGAPLSDLIYPRPVFSAEGSAAAEAALRATDAAQPAIGAVSLGLLRVLSGFGVAPQAAAGHSYGELTALCAAGRMRPEDLHRLSRLRGSLMAAGGGDKGTMLAALAPIATIAAVVAEERLDVVLANKNAPEQVVLSGSKEMIARAKAALDARELRNTPLPVAAAFHSRLVADAAAPLREGLESVALAAGELPVYANTTGEAYPPEEKAAKDLLARQLAEPVEFVSMIEAMYRDGARVFLEIGPGARLTGLVRSILGSREHAAIAVDASNGRKSGIADLARALAQLASLGLAVDLTPWEDGERTLRQAAGPRVGAAGLRKPKVVVTLSGATPTNPRSKQPMPELPPAPKAVEAPAEPRVGAATPRVGAAEPLLPAAPPAPAMSIDALRVSQDGITALQRLQEQASSLHKQYLEGQEAAQKAVLGLIEQQSRLMLGGPDPGLGGASSPLAPQPAPAVAAPAPAPAPLPLAPVKKPAAPGAEGPGESFRAPKPAQGRVLELLLTVVSDKTGYPAETLNLDMGLESDLGIDSIKRVEILAALRERLPDAPVVGPQHIGTLRSLRQIVDFLSAGARGSNAPAAAPGAGGPRPGAGGPRPGAPGPGESFRASAPAAPASGEKVQAVLLAVVSEKTGYPAETLDLDMGLESELGIDSIKRVEILAAMRERLPEAPAVGPQHIGTLRTLRQIIDFLSAGGASPAAKKTAPAPGTGFSGEPFEAPAATVAAEPRVGAAAPRGVGRSVLAAEPFDGPRELAALPSGARVWVAGDGGEFPKAVAAALARQGLRAETLVLGALKGSPGSSSPGETPAVPQDLGALVLVDSEARLEPTGLWSEGSERRLKAAFRLARAAASALRRSRGALLTVSRLDGSFGLGSMTAETDPLSGALAGLAKTARHEWPEVRCRALDAARGQDEALAERVAEELQLAGPLELGLSSAGLRTPVLRPEAASPEPRVGAPESQVGAPESRVGAPGPEGLGESFRAGSSKPLGPGDVVVITGGARGVTAETAVALAESFGAKVALLGRTPEPETEPEWLRPLKTEPEIKKAILAVADGSHPSAKRSENPSGHPSPREIETAYRRHMANREVLATLERIRATGAEALYAAADIRDAASVRSALDRVARELGPVRALVHGAGVLADRFIEDKLDEHFNPVFDTKVAGLRHLLAALDVPALKAIALFSSVSGRFGRAGQADYAMANEALNKAAQSLSRRLPGCRVVSINWGPWEGGMVTPSLRRVFEQEGVPLLGLREGGLHLAAELRASGVEAVVFGGPAPRRPQGEAALSTAFERTVDLESHAFLGAHVINGSPVLPAAMMVEWLAHAALHGQPGLAFCGLDDFKVLKGVVLKNGPVVLKAAAGKAERDGDAWRVPVELRSDMGAHARATAVLASRLPPAEAAAALPALAAYPRSPEEAYRDVLFHGPLLRGIRQVEGCSDAGIAVGIDPAPDPTAWMRRPLRGAWVAEPLAIDAALQAMILWSVERSGAGCLPSGFARYRQFRAQFPKTGVRAVLRAGARGEQLASADVDFLDDAGGLVARITGSEHTIDPTLNAAFRRSVAA